jgi:hypothetical protein
MNRKRAFLTGCLVLFSLLLAGSAWAQLGGILTAVPRPSAYPADWQSTPTLATMLIVSSEPATCYLEVFLTSDKGSGVSTPKFQYVPTGSTNYYTQHLTNWNLHLTGKMKEGFDRTGRLPDGTYVLTVHCFNVMSVTGQPLPDLFASTTFTISVPQPPCLLYPTNESVIAVANPVFQWTPSIRASGSQPAYRYRLVEMLPGQTPLRAIEGNYPLYETSIESGTALSYPSSVPQLVEGHRYAWRIQSIEPASAQLPQDVILPVGTNEGKSQIFTFTYRPNGKTAGAPAGGLSQAPGASPTDEASRGATGPAPDGLPRTPGSGGLKNFADRLVHAMVGRWSAPGSRVTSRAGFASALAMRDDPGPAYGPSAPLAAPDSAGAVLAPADTTAPSAPPEAPPPSPAAAPGPEERGLGPEWLKLHGTASVADETYSRDGSGAPTRPFHSARVTTGLSFGLMNDRVRMPFDALVSGDQVSFRENINQFALHPQFNWAGLQAGNFAPQYSTYTLSDAMVLGAGFELTPRKWRIGFADGKSRKAIAADPSVAIQPQFARNILAGRVGYGDPLTNTVEVSVLRAKDNRNSLSEADSALEVTAEANTVYGMKAQGVLPRTHLKAQLEGAWSLYDRDQRADNPNLKGRAVALKLFRETVLTSVGASFEVLEGGFMSLGNSGITNDRRDVGLTGRAQLASGKLSLNANAGWRNDNVSKVMLAETARKNYTLNAAWQPRPSFGTDFQLGFTSSDVAAGDSVAGSSNITRIVAFSPHLTYAAGGIQQTLTGSATIQSSDNNTTAPFPLANSKSLCLVANWSAAVTPLLAVTLGGNYNRTDLEVAVSEISAFGPGFVWSLPRSRLATSAQLDFTRSRTGNLGTDTEFAPRCELRWQATPHHALIARGNFRRYRYAVGAPEFNERLASVEYAVTL